MSECKKQQQMEICTLSFIRNHFYTLRWWTIQTIQMKLDKKEKDGKVVSISVWSYAELRTQQAVVITD